jgi:uncharacterized protein with GYD domain
VTPGQEHPGRLDVTGEASLSSGGHGNRPDGRGSHGQVPDQGYSAKGMAGVLAEGASARVETVRGLIASVGGTMESFHYAFGPSDVYIVAEVPDTATVVALAAAVSSSGAMSAYETVVLLDPADIDAAAAIRVGYRPPGE